MRNRFISLTSVRRNGAGVVADGRPHDCPGAKAAKTAAKSALPRTPDGHPDLQGTYDLATMTPFERLPGDPAGTDQGTSRSAAEGRSRSPGRRRHAAGSESPSRRRSAATQAGESRFLKFWRRRGGGAVGGYDRLLADPGYDLHDGGRTDSNLHRHRSAGRPCASLSTQPRRRSGARRHGRTADVGRGGEQGSEAATRRGAFDDPEQRPLGERCLLGIRFHLGSAGAAGLFL